jgi:hypothetical protein
MVHQRVGLFGTTTTSFRPILMWPGSSRSRGDEIGGRHCADSVESASPSYRTESAIGFGLPASLSSVCLLLSPFLLWDVCRLACTSFRPCDHRRDRLTTLTCGAWGRSMVVLRIKLRSALFRGTSLGGARREALHHRCLASPGPGLRLVGHGCLRSG